VNIRKARLETSERFSCGCRRQSKVRIRNHWTAMS
jgi:hypothetical protein